MSNYKIPGYLMIALGGLFLSTGGTLFKSFHSTDTWAIFFWRSFFFAPAVILFLLVTKQNVIEKFKGLKIPGLTCGFLFALGSASYMFAMKHTTVANVLFIISTQTFLLSIAGFFFLNEKISKSTLMAVVLAGVGVYIMVGTKISGGNALGNAFAFVVPLAFTLVVIIIRKFKSIDMVPAVAVSGMIGMLLGFSLAKNLSFDLHDIILAGVFGALQYAPGFICLSIGSRTTPAAQVGIFAFTEALTGPIWAWIFISERPSVGILIGGIVILIALILKSYQRN
jgi:drug/metabolite transporter (DMT)-like permease